MMAESLESRKSERKPVVDIALPVRAKGKEHGVSIDNAVELTSEPVAGPTMAFALLTKRGNRQQVCVRSASVMLRFTTDRPTDRHVRSNCHRIRNLL
jgi:hypothetical protein